MKPSIQKEFTLHLPKNHFPICVHTNDDDFAIIFGISLTQNKKKTFIQYLDNQQSCIIEYSWKDVSNTLDPFEICIAEKRLSLTGLKIKCSDMEMALTFDQMHYLKGNRYAPTIMGSFSYLSMECMHSVISLHHHAHNHIRKKQTTQNIEGVSYIEKDRGSSFPSSYLWYQSNQCDDRHCFFLSYTHIPFLFSAFQARICVWF